MSPAAPLCPEDAAQRPAKAMEPKSEKDLLEVTGVLNACLICGFSPHFTKLVGLQSLWG